MDVRFPTTHLTTVQRLGTSGASPIGTSAVGNSQGFSQVFNSTLSDVSQAQQHATALQKELQLGNSSVSLEETMVAIQKAQIGFQATLHIRNRLVQAYSDIMNMQV